MTRLLRKNLRFLVRSFWGMVLFIVIALAVVVQIGRAAFPIMDDYRATVEQQLSQQLGVNVTLGAIKAEWQGLRPRVGFTDMVVHNTNHELIFVVDQVDVEVSLLATLRDWRLAFRRIGFDGLQATLVQSDDGRWSVKGLPRASPMEPPRHDFDIDDPLDIFLFGRRVELRDTQLVFLFRSDLHADIVIPNIRLENDQDFHRLTAAFAVDGDDQSVALTVEGRGDPRDDSSFDATTYLALNAFPSEKVLAALSLAEIAYPDIKPVGWHGEGRVDLEMWLHGTASKGLSVVGQARVAGIPIEPPQGGTWPKVVTSQFEGAWHSSEGWRLGVREISMLWHDFTAPPLNVEIRGSLGEETRLLIEDLDIAAWRDVALRAGVLPTKAHELLEHLQPFGRLSHTRIALRDAEQGHFALQADLDNAGVKAWKGVPAIEGIQGYVEAGAFGGQVSIDRQDGFSLSFPKIHRQPLDFSDASGDVRWEINKKEGSIGISSGVLALANSDFAAAGHFNLRLPFKASTGHEPELTLVVGAKEAPVQMHKLLVPYTVPSSLYDWLDRSIKTGNVRDAGFIYHGSLLKEAAQRRTLQLSAQVSELDLAFDPSWPLLSAASATFLLDDEDLSLTEVTGRLHGLSVHNAQVALVPNEDGEGRAIAVRGSLEGASEDAWSLVKHSPIQQQLGRELNSWQLEGKVTGVVDFLVPLDKVAQGARQNVVLELVNNRLTMPGVPLTFVDVNGPFVYDSVRGVSAKKLQGRLWGRSFQFDIDTQTEPDSELKSLRVSYRGRADIDALHDWVRRPELAFASGSAAVHGQVTVPLHLEAPLVVTGQSDLRGVLVRLPQPFDKPAEQPQPFSVRIEFHPAIGDLPASEEYWFGFGGLAQTRFNKERGQLTGMTVALNEPVGQVEPGVLNVQGALLQANVSAWKQVLDEYLAHAESQSSESPVAVGEAAIPLPMRVVLAIRECYFGGSILENLAVMGEQQQGNWEVHFENPQVSGVARWLEDKQPVQLVLDHLRLPSPAETDASDPGDGDAASAVSAFDELDLGEVPAVDFSVRELSIGAERYGQLSFSLRPVDGGLVAYDLHAELRGLTVSGEKARGAELVWLHSDRGDTTYFSGSASATDLGGVLAAWDLDPAITSEEARFKIEAQWRGAPDQVSLAGLFGVIDIDVQRGRFIRGASVGENPLLKLIGLLNFDTLARRLRLDFSDLNPEGMGYERLSGALQFKRGTIHVPQPLQVETPSTHIQFAGDIDILEQHVEAQLIATLPMTGNLTVAAALTGGLPLAVGVYVVGKVFKKQVDRVSSIRYRIEGPWNEPAVDVERVFENKTDLNGRFVDRQSLPSEEQGSADEVVPELEER